MSERRESRDEPSVVRAEPADEAPRAPNLGGDVVRLARQQRIEPERLERERPVRDAERREEAAEARLAREGERLVGARRLQGAERRDGEQDVAERAGMDRERQGRSSARAASCRRPFVASAVPE